MDSEEIPVPKSKEEMLQRLYLWRGRLEQALARLTPEQLLAAPPDAWSAKDIMAHVAAWEQILLRYHLGGESFGDASGLRQIDYTSGDWDGINEGLYRLYRDQPLPDVQAFFHASYQQVIAALQALPEEDLQKDTGAGFQPGSRLDWIAGNTYEHYAEHIGMLQALTE